jgi:gliding motility-associatede transport system auxiliary component
MQSDWIKTRQTKYTLYVTVYLLVIVAALGAANWLANRHNKSIDSTSNKKFSLSDQTVKVVKGLTQDVTITDYDKTSAFTTSRDLLDRYSNLSSKLRVVYVDPDKKPQLAKAAGIRSYGQIIVDSGTKKEEAKSLTEEEVTGALIRSMKSGERNVCFVSGGGEHGLDDSGRTGYSNAKEALEKSNYKTKTISLLGGAKPGAAITAETKIQPLGAAAPGGSKPEVPSECTVLVLAGPKYEYPQASADAIQTYVNNGGRALVMLDPPLKIGKEETADNVAVNKVLESWGVTMNKDLAIDASGVGQIFGLSEVVPLVTSYESQPIVRDMKDSATAFPLARTLDVKAPAEKLFSTSDNSYATTNLSSAEIRIDPKKDKKGPLTLGAASTVKATAKEGRVVAVGSSNWVSNNILRFNGNRDLFLNMMNWLSSDEDLISIRPKEPEDRRLSLSRRQMSTIFSSSVIGLPLIVIAAGLMVWWKRR